MAETTLEYVRRHLDSEAHSKQLQPLPSDFYSKTSSYSQSLSRSVNSGNSEMTNRLITRQLDLMGSMVRELFTLRARKASEQKAMTLLLPEERYVCSARFEFDRRLDALVDAVHSGQPSFIAHAYRSEMGRSTTVRFLKSVSELVGIDLRRYGPFEPEDLASIPAANAELLISSGEAVEVNVREES